MGGPKVNKMSYSISCGYSCGSKVNYSSLDSIVGSYSGGSVSGKSLDYMIAAEPSQSHQPMQSYDDFDNTTIQ